VAESKQEAGKMNKCCSRLKWIVACVTLAVGRLLLCSAGAAEQPDEQPSQDGSVYATAAETYGCSKEKAAAMARRIRPELRGAFLAGKLGRTDRNQAAIQPAAPPQEPKTGVCENSQQSRATIVADMKAINALAQEEKWSDLKFGRMRREFARRLGTNAVTTLELRAWVMNPAAVPHLGAGETDAESR
jgi:hypothetical protein